MSAVSQLPLKGLQGGFRGGFSGGFRGGEGGITEFKGANNTVYCKGESK